MENVKNWAKAIAAYVFSYIIRIAFLIALLAVFYYALQWVGIL
ncbi:MAG: hypothetical protein ACK5LC_14960 [Coprobacillaceae bacterium]